MAKKKILLIDFDQESLKFLTKALNDEGYEVTTATDGLSGFEKFAELHPDLVIMEAMLPKFHGFELCSRITSHPTKRSPVIIVTGIYKDSVYKTEALRSLGASGFFEKPLNLQELLTKIYELIGKPEVKKAVSMPEADLDKLLQEALSMDKAETKPVEKAKPVEKSVKKPEPVKEPAKTKDDEVDMILRSKLKDLIDEKSVFETHPAPKPAVKPEKEKIGPKVPEPKRVAPPDETVTETIKKTATEPKTQPKVTAAKPEVKVTAKTETVPTVPAAKTEPKPTATDFKPQPGPVFVKLPFKDITEEKEDSTSKKKGAAKFVGLAAGALAIAVVVLLVTGNKKEEAPTFTGKSSNQVAALQVGGTEPQPAKTQLTEEELNQEIEKQIEAYRSQKAQSNKSSSSGGKGTSGNNKTAVKVESDPAAAPYIPPQNPELASNLGFESEQKVGAEKANELLSTTQESLNNQAENAATTEAQPEVLPVAEVKTGDLIPLSMADVEPKVIKAVEPSYPDADRRMGIKGIVTVNALISENGDVLEAVVIRGIKGSIALDKEAVNTVKKWKFLPAEKNGVKVRVWKPITIGFGLNK